MIVNVQSPVLETADGIVHLTRSSLRLFKRPRTRPVWYTRVVKLDRDTPAMYLGRIARQCASIMHAGADATHRPRDTAIRVRFLYA